MKKPAIRNFYLRLLAVCAIGFGVLRPAVAAQLEEIVWVPDADSVLLLKMAAQPGYVVNEVGGGTIIELTLRDTEVGPNVASVPARGLVRGAIVLTEGDNVKIQFLLTEAGNARVEPVNAGLRVAIGAGVAPSEETASAAGAVPVQGSGALKGLHFSRVSGNRVQVDLDIDGDAGEPAVFQTAEPPRIILDFYGVTNDSGKNLYPVSVSALDKIAVAQTEDRLRLVLSLFNPTEYSLAQVEDGYALTIAAADEKRGPTPLPGAVTHEPVKRLSGSTEVQEYAIQSIDFRRTPSGGGRVIIDLSEQQTPVDLQEAGQEVVVTLRNTSIPVELEQRLDVVDFATPITHVDSYADGRNTKMVITVEGQFKQSSVQSGSTLVVDISPLTEAESLAAETDEFGYRGETLSLNFQSITVRAALQVIADFTGLNFVTSDAITGNLSLRLKDVPWDQALDVILQTKGLAMRQKGNVVWVAPAEEIVSKERQTLFTEQERLELEPLVSELIRVSYAKVEDIASLLKSVKAVDSGIGQSSAFGSVTLSEVQTDTNSLLSERGSVTVDARTNSILVQDTVSKLKEIKAVIAQLDIPVRQVQIETRIVEANDDFSRTIGSRLGFTRVTQNVDGLGDVVASGSSAQTNAIRQDSSNIEFADDGLSVNLPAAAIGDDPAGAYAFTIAKLGSGYLSLLDLELSALEAEGKGTILANPKILTTDKHEASIEQGQERLTTFGSAFGQPSTEGQRAVLSLTVLPQITPDDKVILDVDITNDSFVSAIVDTVNTKRINTQALLANGETVVIGGIYQQEETFSVTKIPLLGDIPYLGRLFRRKTVRDDRSELLIFLTPRIIDPALAVQ